MYRLELNIRYSIVFILIVVSSNIHAQISAIEHAYNKAKATNNSYFEIGKIKGTTLDDFKLFLEKNPDLLCEYVQGKSIIKYGQAYVSVKSAKFVIQSMRENDIQQWKKSYESDGYSIKETNSHAYAYKSIIRGRKTTNEREIRDKIEEWTQVSQSTGLRSFVNTGFKMQYFVDTLYYAVLDKSKSASTTPSLHFTDYKKRVDYEHYLDKEKGRYKLDDRVFVEINKGYYDELYSNFTKAMNGDLIDAMLYLITYGSSYGYGKQVTERVEQMFFSGKNYGPVAVEYRDKHYKKVVFEMHKLFEQAYQNKNISDFKLQYYLSSLAHYVRKYFTNYDPDNISKYAKIPSIFYVFMDETSRDSYVNMHYESSFFGMGIGDKSNSLNVSGYSSDQSKLDDYMLKAREYAKEVNDPNVNKLVEIAERNILRIKHKNSILYANSKEKVARLESKRLDEKHYAEKQDDECQIDWEKTTGPKEYDSFWIPDEPGYIVMKNGDKYEYKINSKGKPYVIYLFSSESFENWGEMIEYCISKCKLKVRKD